ncbi:MAG TPA: hypothetical protein OQH54_06295 [Nitrosopumilus sp.]|nr:hypothetical protein [Thermoproteota archaeon]HJJ23307.1 hypothetical protein [Nitrosopumilus sp.]
MVSSGERKFFSLKRDFEAMISHSRVETAAYLIFRLDSIMIFKRD